MVTQDMRHVISGSNNGTYRLYQVLLFILLQGLSCSGRIVHMAQGRTYDKPLLWNLHYPQKDQAPMAPRHDTSQPPVLRDLGFIPKGREVVTPPQIHSATEPTPATHGEDQKAENESLDDEIWDALFEKLWHQNASFDGRNQALPARHRPVPHLRRLGFGVASMNNSRRDKNVHQSQSEAAANVSPESGTEHNKDGLHKLVALGVGSFVGGVSAILFVLFIIYVRCRRRYVRPAANIAEVKPDDPKLVLSSHEVRTATLDIITETSNEYSTSSYTSTTSSGSADTLSTSSDNVSHGGSDTGDMWITPGQIPLATLPPNISKQSSNPQAGHHRVTFADMYISDLGHHPASELESDSETTELLLDVSSNVDTSPDYRRPNQGTDYISDEGAIVSLPMTDVVVVVPPGAVNKNRVKVSVKTHCTSNFPHVKLNTKETFLSSVVELLSPEIEHFSKLVTLRCPYRSLPSASQCLCENDPLCNCTGSRIELRYRHTSTSSSPGTWSTVQCQATSGHYGWPECLFPEVSPEQKSLDLRLDSPERYNQQGPEVSCKCSDSVCSIRTGAPGLYCLVYVPPDRRGSWTSYSRSSGAGSVTMPCVRMCVSVGSKYHWECDGTYGGDRRLQYIQYTVYLGDNTTDTKQRMTEVMRAHGSRQECECLPIDVAAGSDVIVTLRSVYDSDWPLELPYDSITQKMPWSDVCSDFGSLTSTDFRCLPKDVEAVLSDSDNSDIVTVFDVGISEDCGDITTSERLTMTASSAF